MGKSTLERRFAEEYLIDMNATKAAERAGYSARNYGSLRKTACLVLARANVQEMIAKMQEKRLARLVVQQDDVVRELAMIAFSDPSEMFDDEGVLISPKKWSKQLCRSVQAIDVWKFDIDGVPTDFRVRFWDKNKALEKLGLHLGMFGEHTVGDKPDRAQIEKRWTMEFIEPKSVAALTGPKPKPAKSNGATRKQEG